MKNIILSVLVVLICYNGYSQSACPVETPPPQPPPKPFRLALTNPCEYFEGKDTSANVVNPRLYTSSPEFIAYLSSDPNNTIAGRFDEATAANCCSICQNDPSCITFGVYNGGDGKPLVCATSNRFYEADIPTAGSVLGHVIARVPASR